MTDPHATGSRAAIEQHDHACCGRTMRLESDYHGTAPEGRRVVFYWHCERCGKTMADDG